MDVIIKTPKRKAFLTGISGQDGSYLAEYLLSKDYDVYGIVRRISTAENQDNRIAHLGDKVHTDYGDLLDVSSLERNLKMVMPDEIYNLAAMSHVRIGADIPMFTANVNALGALNLLDAYRNICPNARYYQASSSEMFGNNKDPDGFQRETTPMHPVSIYGCSKLFAYSTVRYYRRAYKLFACNGILFNHESPRRGTNFVTNKIVQGAVKIHLGLQDKLELGNMDSFRDWGHSKDYVRAMHSILNHTEPDDFVVSTMETHSVREFCEVTFSHLGMKYGDHVTQNEKFLRPEELKYLKGDSTKARTTLGWKPEYSFHSMVQEMTDYWMEYYRK